MRRFSGVAVSPGVAEGKAFVLLRQDLSVTSRPAQDIEAEKKRLEDAAGAAVEELKRLIEGVRERLGTEFAHIFRSQQTIAEDEAILGEVAEQIQSQGVCAEAALQSVFNGYRALFDQLGDDDYNKGRGADIEDVYKRILRNLLGLPEVKGAKFQCLTDPQMQLQYHF